MNAMENKSILIVDDDHRIVRMYTRRLKKLGLNIHTAQNGLIGLQLAMELQPNIVLADIRMPVMNGLEMVKELRGKGYAKLVVACTASVRVKDKELTQKAGFDDFIAKPVGSDFETIIQTLIEKYSIT